MQASTPAHAYRRAPSCCLALAGSCDESLPLNWNASNAVVEIDPAGERKLDKAKSTERIDGLAALCMALGLHARTPKPEPFEPRVVVMTA